MRVDHVADGFVGNAFDRGQQLRVHFFVLIVYDQHSIRSGQHAHLAARSRHHHDLTLHLAHHFVIFRGVHAAHAKIRQRRFRLAQQRDAGKQRDAQQGQGHLADACHKLVRYRGTLTA